MFNEPKYSECYFPFIRLSFCSNKKDNVNEGYICIPIMQLLSVLFHFLKCLVESLLGMIGYVIGVNITNFQEEMREVFDGDDLTQLEQKVDVLVRIVLLEGSQS